MNKTHKKPKGFGENVRKNQLGKSFEERFGEEQAQIVKEKISKHASRKWEDKFNKDTVNHMREDAKKRMQEYNKDRIWTKEKIKEAITKYIEEHKTIKKSDFWKPKGKPIPTARVIEKLYGNIDTMAIECGITLEKHNRAKYLKDNPDVLKKIMNNNKIFQKGCKYDERYNEETNNKLIQEQSIRMKKRLETEEVWNKGLKGVQDAWNKGITKEDHEGMRSVSKARIKYMQKNKGNFISSHEIKIQQILTAEKIDFIPQYYVADIENKYLADIYIPNKKIIIEIDGEYWHNQENRKELDEKRTKQMTEKGYTVIRITDKEIEKTYEQIKKELLEKIKW